MPIRSPGDGTPRTIRELGLPGRAVTALTRAGVTTIEDLALLTRQDLAAVDGLGPGMIAAIRRIVPEPGITTGPPVDRDADLPEEESPAAPAIPSFESLRAPRRRTAVDLLLPDPAPAASRARAGGTAAPRPPDYTDLLRLGVHVARAVAGVPGRVALWSVREPVHCLRRLIGA